MSRQIRHVDLFEPVVPDVRFAVRIRSGMTLMEMLVVLAIFAMATAVIMPSSSRLLDQATAHAVFFEFQRDVSNLRREANRTGLGVRLIDPSVTASDAGDERTISLRSPWRYTIAPALAIAAGGACGTATVNLLSADRVVMTLQTQDATCRFIRLR